jgi:peptidoglycan/xylan/chitin deacetylase (PgdA/CDA1 family)
MSRSATSLMRAALSALHYSGADRFMASLARGAGAILTLHHVRPGEPDAFDPNGILRVTPEFLDTVVQLVVARGFDVLSLDDAHYRLSEGELDRPFVCFTFDDGYKDNAEFAYPIFKKHGLPFAVYVATDFADGRGDLWWLALEKVVRTASTIELAMDGVRRTFTCATPADKITTYRKVYWWLRRIAEDDARQCVADLCRTHRVDVSRQCAELAMTWDEIRALARDPLVTIGAHTRRHYALARLTRDQARLEIEESVLRLEHEIGRPVRHFSFPYGDEASAGQRDFDLVRELGLKTAVTTRKDLLHSRHGATLTALPRVSLNGEFQQAHYVKVLLSGVPFKLMHAARWLQPRPGTALAAR